MPHHAPQRPFLFSTLPQASGRKAKKPCNEWAHYDCDERAMKAAITYLEAEALYCEGKGKKLSMTDAGLQHGP